MAKKPRRPKLIGDPLRRFKQPKENRMLPKMQAYLETTMEQDHRAGLPLRAALFTSEDSGIPDKWFFDKARALGYRMNGEQDFHEAQLRACFETQDRIPQYVLDFEQYMRFFYSEEEIIRTQGSIAQFRAEMESHLRLSQSEGRASVFGVNPGKRTRESQDVFFLGNEKASE